MRRATPGAALIAFLSILLAACAGAPSQQADGDGTFRDCDDCPLMVRLPPGRFLMGSLAEETEGRGWPAAAGGNERPRHEVTVVQSFAIGRYEVTRREYARFVAEAGYEETGGCLDFGGGAMSVVARPENNWRKPGFAQTETDPALCISWLDAQAYVASLSRRSGQAYRLPSEAEWEYAARAGTTTAYFWGDDLEPACAYANARSMLNWQPRAAGGRAEEAPFPCDDGAPTSAPAGSYRPNGFGLYDMTGNVFEWTQDCNHPSYVGAPADGSAWVDDPACVFRVMRGGSFSNGPRQTRSAARVGRPVSGRAPMLGFRVARSLDAPLAAAGGNVTTAGVVVPGASAADVALFNARCAGCHVDVRTFRGVYGRGSAEVETVIRDGGANSMSMPAWRGELSEDEIRRLAAYVRAAAGWP